MELVDFQEAGIRLYADLAAFYYRLGEKRMTRILHRKLEEAVDNALTTRFLLVDTGETAHKQEQPAERNTSHVTQLQWQEGSREPNTGTSNAEKETAGWELPEIPEESSLPADTIGRLYNEGLRVWLDYETAAYTLYQELAPKDDWYQELMDEAKTEVTRIQESLTEEKA